MLKYLLAACVLLSGCNGVPTAFIKDNPAYDEAFVVHSGGPLPLLLMGSAVQWNEDYAVTVKHVPYLDGAVYQGRGDVQFFKHKASMPLPVWRQYSTGETLTAVGFSSLYVPVKGQGHALAALVRLDAQDGVFYATHDGPTAKGMSGGPVFGDDGDVVGINVAYLTESDLAQLKRQDLAHQPRVSIFMPYNEIAKEWRRFQASQVAQR
ncbi:trypsin-like peptidase domain-containing protein [Pseudomonas sp. NPDC007930]|uniref:trypsin-like peptidase domain-containing protein n=1 Tax=Pseudomonas sp. NPDC007930 TaxID=3364417 RepID=UPI0036ECECA1